MPAIALPHNTEKKKHWAELRLDQCFDPGALQAPSTAPQPPPGRGSLFASEIYQLGTAPMAIPSLYEGLKCQGIGLNIKKYAHHVSSVALGAAALFDPTPLLWRGAE